MKTIYFSELFGIKQLVLKGKVTAKRILVNTPSAYKYMIFNKEKNCLLFYDSNNNLIKTYYLKYKIGDVCQIKNDNHCVRITGINPCYLHVTVNEWFINEGVIPQKTWNNETTYYHLGVTKKNCPHGQYIEYESSKECYASLIDELHGKGTWDANPFSIIYSFELLK